jgi:predicted RNase H-like nuclease (RuvC/YqgF family)
MEDLQRFLNYKSLFSKCYLENNEIESETITQNELDILEDLDHDEVFENLKDLLQSLLIFKRQSKNPDPKALETINSFTENSKSEEDLVEVLTEENKKLKGINEDLQLKVETLTQGLASVNLKVAEQEKLLKKQEIIQRCRIKTCKKDPLIEITEYEPKSKTIVTPHKRIASFANANEAIKTIKSVKFEYYVGSQKVKDVGVRNLGGSLNNSPVKAKSFHARSTSNFIKFNK